MTDGPFGLMLWVWLLLAPTGLAIIDYIRTPTPNRADLRPHDQRLRQPVTGA